MVLAAVLFGLLAVVAWAYTDFFGAKASKRSGGMATAVMITVVAATTFDLVYLVFFREHTVFDATGLGYAALSGLAFTIANLAFYKGLEYGPVSIVSPLGAIYPLVTALCLVLLFGHSLSLYQGVGVGVVTIGIVAASGMFERVKNGRRLSKGPLLGLVAALFWGLAWALIAQAVERIGWQLTSAVELSLSAIAFLPFLPLLNRVEPGMVRRLLPSLRSVVLVGSGILMEVGFLAVSIGIDLVPDLATAIVVISSCYPVIVVFLALRHLGEKFDPIPIAGAFVALAGVVVMLLG